VAIQHVGHASSLVLRLMIPSPGVQTYKWTTNEHVYCANHGPSYPCTRSAQSPWCHALCGDSSTVPLTLHQVLERKAPRSTQTLGAFCPRSKRCRHPRRATDTSPPSRVKNITFTNPKASGAYARVHALPRLFVSCASRVLREWRDHTPSQL
jgi:hypothetical protein